MAHHLLPLYTSEKKLLHVYLWVWRTFGGYADPVEVSSEFLGYVGLAPSWETNHHNDCGRVGKVGGAGCCQEDEYIITVPVYRLQQQQNEQTSCALEPERADKKLQSPCSRTAIFLDLLITATSVPIILISLQFYIQLLADQPFNPTPLLWPESHEQG